MTKSAAEVALDEIGAVFGCPPWEHPSQVTRDVAIPTARAKDVATIEALVQRIEALEKDNEQLKAGLAELQMQYRILAHRCGDDRVP